MDTENEMSEQSRIDREEAAARRNLLAQDVMERTGISEAMIAELVEKFYGRVREDALLGPIFAAVQDWDEHLARLRDFWSSVVLTTGRYHGQPMRAHLPFSLIGNHFDRWLDLFEQTAREVCPPAAAAHFIDKARRIADSFEMASATQAGRIASPRHVFRS
jgi:hemoglobin